MQRARDNRVWDLIVLLCAALFFAAYSFLVSRHRILWSDELFAWSLVTDGSWKHMFRAWNLGADSGGVGFYVLCRIWLSVFGHTEIAFRAFSAAGVFAAFAAIWFTLRRFYEPALIALSLFIVFCGSPIILWQVVQTRFYGLLLGAAGWALYAMLRSSEESHAGNASRRSTLLLVFLTNVLLVSAHPFGLIYSGLLLTSGLISDRFRLKKRPAYYLAVVLTWPILLFSRTAMKNLARVSHPWFWTTQPHGADLLAAYKPTLVMVTRDLYLLPLLLVTISVLIWRRRNILTDFTAHRRGPLLCAALVLLSAPLLLWTISQFGTSYYVDRYYLPYIFGGAILLTELLHSLFCEVFPLRSNITRFSLSALAVCFIAYVGMKVLLPYPKQLIFPPKDFTAGLAAMLPQNEPIVIPKTDIFDVMAVYRSTPTRPILFPYDWDLALDPRSPKWLVSAEREIDNADRAEYYPGQIVKSTKLLKTLNRFAVVTDGTMPWLAIRIADNPAWTVRKLGDYSNGFWSNTIWQVDRVR